MAALKSSQMRLSANCELPVNDLSTACPPRPQTGKDAKVGWLRPEALASVTKAENVPLPALISESDADGLDDSKRPNFAVVSCRDEA